jgi:hypothetical protein
LSHIERCAGCRDLLGGRRQVRERLAAAVRSAPDSMMAPGFETRLQARLREGAARPAGMRWLLAPAFGVLAALAIFGTIAGVWVNRQSSGQVTAFVPPAVHRAPERLLASASFQKINYDASYDHKHCLVESRFTANPRSLELAGEQYARCFIGMDKAVERAVASIDGGKLRLKGARSCVSNGRRFAHFALANAEGREMSVLVTRKEDDISEDDLYSVPSQEHRIASFCAGAFRVFVMSDMSEEENFKIADTITASLRDHIAHEEVAVLADRYW